MLRRVLLIFVMAVVVGSLNTSVLGTPDAWYPFNGNADDESGNGYHGTVYGATLIPDRDGNLDSAYCFDGDDDYILVPNYPSVTTDLTIDAWVYPKEALDGRHGGYIVNDSTYLQYGSYDFGVDDDLFPQVSVYIDQVRYQLLSSEALSFETWARIRGVYDGTAGGSGLTIYVNGQERGHLAVSGTLDPSSYPLYFGVDLGNPLTSWGGCIDDVSITVPEPASLSLLSLGGLGLLRRKRTYGA